MIRSVGVAVAVAALTLIGTVPVAAAQAGTVTPAVPGTKLVGELGFEGGAYPGHFHPGPGTVEVEFDMQPLVIQKKVGPSGHFSFSLGPGQYTVVGCGPSASGVSPGSQCSKPKSITLYSGEVRHIRLVWALVP